MSLIYTDYVSMKIANLTEQIENMVRMKIELEIQLELVTANITVLGDELDHLEMVRGRLETELDEDGNYPESGEDAS